MLAAVPLIAPLVTACNPVQTLNALTFTNGLVVTTNLSYGPHARHALDVYRPENAKGAPVVVFVHGGSWTGGSKNDYKFVGESLARAGYVTAIINYRLAPENRYPAYVRDTALAVRWVRDHAGEHGGHPGNIFLMGHSAGAFNVMEAAVNRKWFAEAGVNVRDVRGVIGIAGPYDYDFRLFASKNAFPEGADPADIMPARHVRADAPPVLILTAANDQVVHPDNARRMIDALQRAGVPVAFKEARGVDHATIIGALASRLTFLAPVRDDVIAFIGKHAAAAGSR